MHVQRTLLAALCCLAMIATACSSSATTDTATTAGERDSSASRDILQDSQIGATVGHIELPDVSNDDRAFRFRPESDRVLVVYFGYTSCPDVCPTTMADLRTALSDMESGADKVDVAMVTVDPDHDTSTTLQEYVQFFIPGAHAIRTDDADLLRTAADAFGVSYSVTELDSGEVTVGHSPYLYAVDDSGSIRAVWPFGAQPQTIAEDLTAILAG